MSINPIELGSFWMPKASSTTAGQVDWAFDVVLWICIIFFVGLMGAMFLFAYKYRRRKEGEKTSAVSHNTTLEITWTVLPLLLLGVLFLAGLRGYANALVAPAEAIEIKVTGAKWFWTFTYPNGYVASNTLVVPKDRPVKLLMSSQDVVHSFFVPEFRIKQDVVPGQYTTMWFQATEAKDVQVECAEYCGTSHSDMLATITVKPEAEFKEWLEKAGDEGKGLTPAEYGQKLYTSKNCFTCHSTDGSRIQGPTFKGVFGRSEALESGSAVTVDENYIRESLMEPNAKIVKGYPAVMPTYKGTLKDKEIDALIAYLKTVK
ncbi:MAG: cytochrome c oxidase subunit II [Minicystis sp.]